jgi:hypothetical protein
MAKKYKLAPFYRTRGDTRPFVITIRDPDSGAIVDLTGAASAKMYMQDAQYWRGEDYDAPWSRYNQGSAQSGGVTLKVSAGTCTFASDRTTGKVTYAPTAADMDTAGEYVIQVKVVLSDGTILSAPQDGEPDSRVFIRGGLASLA